MKRILAILIFTVSSAHAADEPTAADLHPFGGFTRPYRTIKVAAGDFGRVATVSVKPGDQVTTSQSLLKLDTSILEVGRQRAKVTAESTSRIRSYEIELQLVERRLQNLKSLSVASSASQEEIKRAEADVQIASANVDEARQQQRELQLALSEIEARIAAREVRSPIDGVVTDVLYEVGEYVPGNAPDVAIVVDLNWLRTTLFLPTLDALKLKAGTTLKLEVIETGNVLEAVVERVSRVTQANSGRVRVELVIDNKRGKCRSGLRCRLLGESLQQAFVKPHFAALPGTRFAKLGPIQFAPAVDPEASQIVIRPGHAIRN